MKSGTSFIHIITFFSVLILFNACGQQTSARQRTIKEVDGVTIVMNPREPLNPELRIIFEEDLTIGVEDGVENYMFGNQVFMNTDDEGNIYVTDWDRKSVRKYDPNGNFLQSIGRPGQGPGEFQDISEVRFDSEGNIYLNDVKSQRISFLSKKGNYLKGVKFPTIFERVVINSRGFFIAMSVDNIELGKGKKWDYFYGLFDENFNLMAEFLRLPQEVNTLSKKSEDSIAQVFADSLSGMAFQPYVNYVLDKNDLIYFGYPENYEIRVYSSEGKLMKIIQRDFEPVEISERHKEYFEQSQSEQFLAKIPANEEKRVFELVKYPKYKPAYERFTLMENGWIFVVVDSVRDGSNLVDVFNKDGEYLAQYETDVSTDWLSFNNGKAYAVATIDDYKFIKRYNFEILGYRDN
ncbi:MAG: 6-bladed beta-propeller [Candidatus Aminicenantes bacterium]|nr:6-bladed beta-propeller [Candidatus Aminicenantes bacterium]MDH5744605.1 6-bladed beta-propeller [Candidatus Aminicenantes bacterium]